MTRLGVDFEGVNMRCVLLPNAWHPRTDAHPGRRLYPAPLLLLQADRQPEGNFGGETRVEWAIVTLPPQGWRRGAGGKTGESGRISQGLLTRQRTSTQCSPTAMPALTVKAKEQHANRQLDNRKSMELLQAKHGYRPAPDNVHEE